MNTTNFFCTICKKNFKESFNLRKHVGKFHPGKLEELMPKKPLQCAAICYVCSKSFVNNSNLTRHVKKFHSDTISLALSTHECEICQKSFTNLPLLESHMKSHIDDNVNSLECIICKRNSELQHFTKTYVLYEHFKNKHGIEIITETLQFISLEEFENWKSQEENRSNELFVQYHGMYETKTCGKIKYVCHRSGSYKCKGSGTRHLKTQGSKKINGLCPAEMSLKVMDGQCVLKYVKTHVGHTNELGHLNLTEAERNALAVKIAAKIPFEVILDQVKETLCDSTLERMHLTTKKDLHNIEQSFNINNESHRHENDAISVEVWVKEMESTGCVLFYKPQGKDSEYSQLKIDDFALIIMNQGQMEMMQNYGNDCICIDGTHGINAYHFDLTTVLVLDDMREGFPCCFLISNRTDEEMMYILFTCMKNKLGRPLQPKVFMSDMAQSFYNAWIRVMDLPQYRLYCTWHIDRAWRNNLTKVKSKEKQVIIYKQLRTLLQERDINAFSSMIQNFLTSMLSHSDTSEFGHYFKVHYVKSKEAWAYCYRINSGINTNMHIESMHRTIKYIYLNGKVNKRLDKAVHVLMKFVRDKLFSRLIVINKGKISAKLKDLRARHKTSQNLQINSVLKNQIGWTVPSSSTQELYSIEEKQKHCDCKLFCSDCQACIHRYSCSCLDSSIKWNMCKHIHLVCQFLKVNEDHDVENTSFSQYEEGNSHPTIGENIRSQEELQIINALIATKTNFQKSQFADEKDKLKLEFLEIIKSVESLEEINFVKKLIAPIRPGLEALRNSESTQLCDKLSEKIPCNKKIDQQRQLYKTKKTIMKRKMQLLKPDNQEEIEIASNLGKDANYSN